MGESGARLQRALDKTRRSKPIYQPCIRGGFGYISYHLEWSEKARKLAARRANSLLKPDQHLRLTGKGLQHANSNEATSSTRWMSTSHGIADAVLQAKTGGRYLPEIEEETSVASDWLSLKAIL